jgi:hypothetical protein
MGARMHQGQESADGFGAERDEFELLVDELHATVRSIASGLPAVYGLARFPAPERTVGGWAQIDDRSERIALVFGQFAGSGPLAAVHTTQGSAEFLAGGLHYGEGTLDPAYALTPEDELPVLRRFEHFSAGPDLTLPVGGQDRVFHCRESGSAWYAWADSLPSGLGVVIEAAGIAPSAVEFSEICDLAPFLDGHRVLLREASWAQ